MLWSLGNVGLIKSFWSGDKQRLRVSFGSKLRCTLCSSFPCLCPNFFVSLSSATLQLCNCMMSFRHYRILHGDRVLLFFFSGIDSWQAYTHTHIASCLWYFTAKPWINETCTLSLSKVCKILYPTNIDRLSVRL